MDVLWNGEDGFKVKQLNGRGRQYVDPCYYVDVFKKNYAHCLQPVEGEELWPISANPRPQAPGYVRMPGRPKKNDRKREETEKPKGKKMSKHGTIIKCSLCGGSGHNKSGCNQNPEKGKKNARLTKISNKKTEVVLLLQVLVHSFCCCYMFFSYISCSSSVHSLLFFSYKLAGTIWFSLDISISTTTSSS